MAVHRNPLSEKGLQQFRRGYSFQAELPFSCPPPGISPRGRFPAGRTSGHPATRDSAPTETPAGATTSPDVAVVVVPPSEFAPVVDRPAMGRRRPRVGRHRARMKKAAPLDGLPRRGSDRARVVVRGCVRAGHPARGARIASRIRRASAWRWSCIARVARWTTRGR